MTPDQVVVYSALMGGYDTPKDLPDGIKGVMYTDQREQPMARGWTKRYDDAPHWRGGEMTTPLHGDSSIVIPMLNHKYWKTHPGKVWTDNYYDIQASIWVDASIDLHPGFVEKAIAALGNDDLAMVRHPWRDCIYEEAHYSSGLPRYFSLAQDLREQAEHYRNIGHPAHGGLQATGIRIARHTDAVLEMMHHWWMECLNWSHQDQVSLPVLLRLYQNRIRINHNLGWMDGWDLYPHLK